MSEEILLQTLSIDTKICQISNKTQNRGLKSSYHLAEYCSIPRKSNVSILGTLPKLDSHGDEFSEF